MGNLVSTFMGGILLYYMKVKSKLTGAGGEDNVQENAHSDSLLSTEEKKENNNDSAIHVNSGSNNHTSTQRNEYQLLKSNEEYEYLKDNKQENLIEEISKEIKSVNIEFGDEEHNEMPLENNEKNKNDGTHHDEIEDNIDDLKMQILSEHEDN
jgi:hypothetical protein